MFQVLVKTTQHMLGSYSVMVEDLAAALTFVQHPQVWWYSFGSDEEWEWRRGGAWSALADRAREDDEDPLPAPAGTGGQHDEAEEEDDRW